MAEANEVRSGEIEHISLQVAGIQRDLLQRFFSGNHPPRKIKMETEDEELEQEEDEIELSLGLSLNGRFGVDPVKAGKLTRSSSISDFFLHSARSSGGGTWMRPSECTEAPLARTCSLPAETEEWRRRRKELQCLRRMEAKRKRDEKQRVFRKDGVYCSNDNGDKRGEIVNGVMGESRRPLGMSNWGRGMEPERPNSLDRRRGGSSCGEAEAPPSSLQGSNGSPGSVSGSGSSLVSDYDSQMARDMNKNIEARSPNSVQSLPQQKEQKPSATPGNSPSKKLLGGEIRTKETIVRNVIEDMPCVSTIGDGPNGKRIEGFLYRYKKGEEVRIVCVCHGTFLSPAEFVKHAGGGDVAHPLKHIVVNTTSFL